MFVHAVDPSTWEADTSFLKTVWIYIVRSSRPESYSETLTPVPPPTVSLFFFWLMWKAECVGVNMFAQPYKLETQAVLQERQELS